MSDFPASETLQKKETGKKPLLTVENLTIHFQTEEGLLTATEDVSFDLRCGEVFGVVGESGSGKSVMGKAIMQLNRKNTVYGKNSKITLHLETGDIDVLKLKTERARQIVRGREVSMIFQEPMASFAPAIRIGTQMVEQLLIHTSMTKKQAKKLSIEMLDRVGITEPAKRFQQYAFELSGGMRQRTMIAMALSTRPKLLIADEPTTALDVIIQRQILDLMKELKTEFGMSVIFITHDLGVAAQFTDRLGVMYLGKMLEKGGIEQVILDPHHPYTQGLIHAIPDLNRLDQPLQPIPGDIPNLLERPTGCVFHTRCPKKETGLCDVQSPPEIVFDNRQVNCHLIEKLPNLQ